MKKKVFPVLALLALVCTLSFAPYVLAEVPHLINYQGRLTDTGGVPLNGSYNLTFRIYDAETAGNLLWEETQTGIVINKGIFAVLLGSVANLNLAFDKPYFLEIKVGNEVMSPRQRMASGAYALRAEHGVPKGVIVMWSGTVATIPSGWALCDGNNGTPDLRDRFVVGARQDDGGIAKTNITGTLTQNGDGQIPSHTHGVGTLTTVNAGAHTHGISQFKDENHNSWGLRYSDTNPAAYHQTESSGAHTHSLSGSTAVFGVGTKNIATYYALAFIMKLE